MELYILIIPRFTMQLLLVHFIVETTGRNEDANFEANSKIFFQKVLLMYNYTMM